MSRYNDAITTIEQRLIWLNGKIDPSRGPNSAMAREIQGMEEALVRVKRERMMREFLASRDLIYEFNKFRRETTLPVDKPTDIS